MFPFVYVYLANCILCFSLSTFPINTYIRRDGSRSLVYEIKLTSSKFWRGTIMASQTILDPSKEPSPTARRGLMVWIIQVNLFLNEYFFDWLTGGPFSNSLAESDTVLCNGIQDRRISCHREWPNLHLVSPAFHSSHSTRPSPTAYEFSTGKPFFSQFLFVYWCLTYSSKMPFGPSCWPPPLLTWPWQLRLHLQRHFKFLLVSLSLRCLFLLEVPWKELLNVVDRLLLNSIQQSLRFRANRQVTISTLSSLARLQIKFIFIHTKCTREFRPVFFY